MSDLVFLSASEQAEMIRRKELSPVELTRTYVDRIEELNGSINAFVTVTGDRALDEARAAEDAVARGDDLPPFHGVPLPIKDLAETAGIRTTFSTKELADYVPEQDISSVRRLKEAGFIVIGKTNVPEFGTVPVTESELNGFCHNPWDTDHTPGGSSGGAAAAVASGMASAAHASDGGGSIRIPASCCGLFGLKATRGRVSHAPYADYMLGFSTNGSITRTVRDSAAILDVLAGYEPGDPYWAPPPERPFVEEVGAAIEGLRIAYTAVPPLGVPVDPVCLAAMNDAAELLESLGHKVEEATPDWDDPEVVPQFFIVWQTLATAFSIDPERMEPLNRLFTEQAKQVSSTDYVKAVIAIYALARKVVAFWDEYDLLLTPTLALPPVPIGWQFEDADPNAQIARMAMFTPYAAEANITGQPAATLPTYWSDAGLPIGVQLMARPADEATLLRVCAQVEEARPWAGRRPPGF